MDKIEKIRTFEHRLHGILLDVVTGVVVEDKGDFIKIRLSKHQKLRLKVTRTTKVQRAKGDLVIWRKDLLTEINPSKGS